MSQRALLPPAAVPRRTAPAADPELVAGQIAVRTADPQVLAGAVAAASRQSRRADVLAWHPGGLARGHAGVAVLCAAMDAAQPGADWDRVGHHHLAAAAAAASPHDASLFTGLAGLGFAATLLAGGRRRYGRLLSRVDEALEPRLDRALSRLGTVSGCRVSDFDLVSGLTGAGVYLLSRHQVQARGAGGPPAGAVEAMLGRLLSGLARLMAEPCHPRRWHTPAALAAGPLRGAYPNGLHNCGLAHGAPGPLALLSLAMLAGVRVPDAPDAVRVTAGWLAEHQTGTSGEPDWPDGVPLDGPARRGPGPGYVPGRAAWCYGAPGVARSLWLAGVAAGEPAWQDLATRTIRAVAARAGPAWGLSTQAFCHGAAGLLQVLRRFAADLDDPAVGSAAGSLADELAAGFDAGTPLGVRTADPDGVLVDHPGLLDGAAGVALALLGAPQVGGTPGSAWDRMFLLG